MFLGPTPIFRRRAMSASPEPRPVFIWLGYLCAWCAGGTAWAFQDTGNGLFLFVAVGVAMVGLGAYMCASTGAK
jgi:hypothetical protein